MKVTRTKVSKGFVSVAKKKSDRMIIKVRQATDEKTQIQVKLPKISTYTQKLIFLVLGLSYIIPVE